MDTNPPDPVFAQARAAFVRAGHTLKNEVRDFSDWRRGRQTYGLWAIALDREEARALLAQAQRQLAGLLLAPYRRQPHVTLAACGFPCRDAVLPDDFPLAVFEAQVRALQQLPLAPFVVETGALASFSAAPFIEIHDRSQTLRRLNAAFERQRPPQEPYVPHLTVGLYNGEHSCETVLAGADSFSARRIVLPVERLSFMTYEAAEIGGPLHTQAEFDLAARELRWHGSPFV